jgi:hypothetical protein
MEQEIRRAVVWGVIGALAGGLLGLYYGFNRTSGLARGVPSSLITSDTDELFVILCALVGAGVLGFGLFIVAHFILDR